MEKLLDLIALYLLQEYLKEEYKKLYIKIMKLERQFFKEIDEGG